MTEMQYELDISLSRTKTDSPKNKRRSLKKPLTWAAVLLVWGALIYGSFALAQHYINGIQTQLTEIQLTNQQHVDALNGKIADLQTQLDQNEANALTLQEQFNAVDNQLEALKEKMALAGDSLNSSDDTKKALSQRITDLSKELENLRGTIKKLEEAARVY